MSLISPPSSPLVLARWLDPDLSAQLVRLVREQDRIQPRSFQGVVDRSKRDCQFVFVPPELVTKFSVIRRQVADHFGCSLQPNLLHVPIVYRYREGVGFMPHHDEVTALERARAATNGQPVMGGDITCVAFLSGPESYGGGDLFFPKQGWTYKPPMGSIIAYPATRTYVHGVSPVTWGERISVVWRFYIAPANGNGGYDNANTNANGSGRENGATAV